MMDKAKATLLASQCGLLPLVRAGMESKYWYVTREGLLEFAKACYSAGFDDGMRRNRCGRCGGPMSPGIALAQTATGSPDFPGAEVVTLSPGGPGKLIDCLKCEACGWSTTAP